MFNFNDLGKLPKLFNELKNLSEKNEEIKKELEKIEVVGESGAGFVKVYAKGTGIISKVEISDELLKMNDKQMLEDLLVGAINDAIKKTKNEMIKLSKEKFADMPFMDQFDNFFKNLE